MTPISEEQQAIETIRAGVARAWLFAHRHEVDLLAIVLSQTRRRKHNVSISVTGTAMWFLVLLYGGKKQCAKRVGMSYESVREWRIMCDEIALREYFKERDWNWDIDTWEPSEKDIARVKAKEASEEGGECGQDVKG